MVTRTASRPTRSPGFALAMVLLVLVLITVMGLVLGAMGATNLHQIRATGEKTVLLHSANGGLHELMDVMYNNSSYGTAGNETGSGSYASTGGSSDYWWTFDPSSSGPYCTNNLDGSTNVTGYNGRVVPPGMALLYVAADEDQAGSTSPVWVAAVATNRFPYAVASDGTISLADVSSTVPGQGNVRSNNTGGSPNINADVVDGQTFSRDGNGSISVAAGSGPENYNQPPFGIPDIPIPAILQSWSPGGISGAHPTGGRRPTPTPGARPARRTAPGTSTSAPRRSRLRPPSTWTGTSASTAGPPSPRGSTSSSPGTSG